MIIEAATGHPLAGELHRRILAPLRLRATTLPTAPGIAGRHAHGYFLRPRQDVTVGTPSVQWAAGALVSNADDLARFYRALLGGRLLHPGLLRLMTTTVAAPRLGAGGAYGFGLDRLPARCGALGGTRAPAPVTRSMPSPQVRPPPGRAVRQRGPLSAAGFFGAPKRAGQAINRPIHAAYCR